LAYQRTFAQRLSSSRRGARLARLLAVEELRTWLVSSAVTKRAEQIVAELAANAALHGHVRGRDFRLTFTFDEATGVVRIEVTDTRGEKLPAIPPEPQPDDESGRGLLLVAALADRWRTEPYVRAGLPRAARPNPLRGTGERGAPLPSGDIHCIPAARVQSNGSAP
jgi:anti-sigma regulatory factor (Ser/Thr protein kinase)